MKRSHEPILWALFGAGGVVSALLGPVLILVTGILAPTAIGLPPDALGYPRALAFAQSIPGKVLLLAVISLFLFHAAHRIFHALHDVGVHGGPAGMAITYGGALVASFVAAGLLLTIGI
jgi:fumarate reductase subunit D